jgi:hypothetical protein
MDHFNAIGIIKNEPLYDEHTLNLFVETIHSLREKGKWSRSKLIELFNSMIPEFNHKETGKFLDGRM